VALGCGRPEGKILPAYGRSGPRRSRPEGATRARPSRGEKAAAARPFWAADRGGRQRGKRRDGGVIGVMQALDELGVKPALMSLCSGSAFFGLPLAPGVRLSTRRASSPGSGRRTTSTSTGAGSRPSGRAPTRGSPARGSTASSWIRARGRRTCAPGGASALREARSEDEQHRTPAALPHLVAHAAQQ
jgi:hypothetical protein